MAAIFICRFRPMAVGAGFSCTASAGNSGKWDWAQPPGQELPLLGRASWQQRRGRRSLVGEVWEFLRANKKWWMLPIVGVFALFGLLMLVGGTAAAPFIYSLF